MGKHEVHSSGSLAMNPLSTLSVSKARKPKFELTLKIYDLINVPLVTGTSFVKWHLPTSTAAEHRGRTDRAFIKEHKVIWIYKRKIHLRLLINKQNKLQDCMIHFEVIQDCSTSVKSDKIILGKIELNLAEYVHEDEIGLDGEHSVVRRYLMQDSKINSLLKVGIGMRQIDGDTNYMSPPLKTANMFGGITGIVAGDQDGKDENGHTSMSIRSRDQGEIQDIYRQILAASWIPNDGQLPADECIDDIFNGGSGWSHNDSYKSREQKYSDDEICRTSSYRKRNNSSASQKSQALRSIIDPYSTAQKHDTGQEISSTNRDTRKEIVKDNSEGPELRFHSKNEVDEISVRDNLTAWKTWQGPVS